MALGKNSKWNLIKYRQINNVEDLIDYSDYLSRVEKDVSKLKMIFPYVSEIVIPTTYPYRTKVYEVYLVNKDLINALGITKQYCMTNFDIRKVIVFIPFNYNEKGCHIVFSKELDINSIQEEHKHFNDYFIDGYEFCAGVPESFAELENVILENCRTAENYIIQIDSFINKEIDEIKLIEYSHGVEGRVEYGREKKKFKTKR